ncbi:Synaptopodin 2-like protein [Acipenser ruthenus]|uniref:Synaptopodin 2-like protein n=1 Tax=Acipenser ruthenus TaxID=7906 RepID=A0A444UKZ7_ACIRT|nr:Synaptopodin 2-like protein [Acipenser ruthenus]
MVTEEQVVISLSGGAPWGFRLQGGTEHSKPLQVAKVRKRSKACRAGLREGDELLSINEKMCGGLSHAQAMTLIDSAPGTLRIRIRRSPAGFQSVVLFTRSPSPRIDRDYRAALRALSPPVTKPAATGQPDRSAVMSPTGGECLIRTLDPHRDCLISPLDSEAYYGETDSDADTALVKQRRPKRRSPSATPVKPSGHTSPEETSEMSGYESAPDARPHTTLPGLTQPQDAGPGVARREILFQPRPVEEEEEAGLEEALSYPSDGQGAAEVDSGFQEPPSVPLVSPERAKDASRLLFSSSQLVPMVGPVDRPVDEELTTSYKDKARQAKLHRSESVQEKQVKEARSKCRTIASLLTAAPNPHSKGVLMFKKRRQRSKKYTLISFGSVEGDMEAREEDEEEGEGAFPTSESEFDEEGFSAAPDTDPDWDRNYLDILERKKTPAQTLQGPPQGLSGTVGKGAQLYEQQQRRRAEENFVSEAARQGEQGTQGNQGTPTAVPSMSPAQPPPSFGMMNGDVPPARHPDLVKSPPAPAPPAPPAHSVPGAFSVPAQQPANSLLDRTNLVDEGELNLGKKISTPKDIMLEELSLLGNKGSKMFKQRQKRVEKFIWENNPDIFNDESMDNFQKFVPSLGGAMQSGHSMMDVGGHLVSGQMVGQAGTGRQQQAPVPPPKPGMGGAGGGAGGARGDNFQKFVPNLGGAMQSGHSMMDVGGHLVSGQMVGQAGTGRQQQAPVPPPKPGMGGAGGGAGGARGGAGGAGGGAGGDGTMQTSHGHGEGEAHQSAGKGGSKQSITMVRTYISPWERAMRGNAELTATMRSSMPGPCSHKDLVKYKSFNRTAMPYGGYEKASKLMTFQLPEFDTAPEEPEHPVIYQHDINSRPCFNRTPIGWVGSGEPCQLSVDLENVPFEGETDDL